MHHKLAQFVGHGRLLNLFFGSSQTDVWLPRYGHFKFWGGVVLQTKFTFGLHVVVYVPIIKFILGSHAWTQHVNYA